MDIENKLCIVTGANSGIGKEIVREFARKGAYVIMICRNEKKAEKAKRQLINDTGHTGIEVMLADLAVQYDVRKVATQIAEKFEEVDVLVNNAGIIPGKRKKTIDGIERTLAINHLAPFLLTNLLLDKLKKARDARVITTASGAHRRATGIFDLNNLQLRNGYKPMEAYGLSKLCNIMFTHELAKRCKDTSVTANSFHPGLVRTQLTDESRWLYRIVFTLGKPFMRSPKKGAETAIYLATSDEVKSVSGRYFKDKRESKPDSIAYRDELTEKLWEISEKLTGIS
jgi:NAD(P)-dependent dehydrogenase (short-subunit alcohol dehydrogenase family)